MLVIFYIVSALSAVFASMFFRRGNFKQWAISMLITIITGTAFCLPIVQQIFNDLKHVNLGAVFVVLSLIVWQSAFIFLDTANLFNYEVCALLFALIIYLIVPKLFPFEGWAKCDTEHVTTERINILTSKEDTLETNIYGESFIVKKVVYIPSNKSVYQFFYLLEDGTPVEEKISAKYTTICFIEEDQSPYLEKTCVRNCSGYNPETQKHILTTATTSYILYIPEGSILKDIQFD